MDYTCIFFGVLFTIAGFVFACGKGHIHLSAWKNMPQEEKEKIKSALVEFFNGKVTLTDQGLREVEVPVNLV